MKRWKKLTGILLAAVMAFTLSATAFAAGFVPSDTCRVTFLSADSGVALANADATQRSWNGYRLLDLDTSLKGTCGHAADGHDSNCYNYAYRVNDTYREALQSVVADPAGDAAKVTDDEIIQYISDLSGKDNAAALQAFARSMYEKIKDKEPDKRLDKTNEVTANIPQGYWLFADVTTTLGTNEARSLIVLDTKGEDKLTISTKADKPKVEKNVKDIDDIFGSQASANVGDMVEFQVTGTLPKELFSYIEYQYTFHDTMSKGLTYNDDAEVYLLDENGRETKLESVFVVTTTANTDNTTSLKVSCNDILEVTTIIDAFSIDAAGNVWPKIVLKYSAVLNDNAFTTDKETNKVYLEYTNDPDGSQTGNTPEKEVDVYDFEIVIDKYDSSNPNKKLEGAQFVLYKKDATGGKQYYHLVEAGPAVDPAIMKHVEWYELTGSETLETAIDNKNITAVTTDSNGAASFPGLAEGTYYLEEVEAPDGYNLLDEDPKIIVNKKGATSDSNRYYVTAQVKNSTGTELPETGGMGTKLFYAAGSILAVGAAVLLITRKRMNMMDE